LLPATQVVYVLHDARFEFRTFKYIRILVTLENITRFKV